MNMLIPEQHQLRDDIAICEREIEEKREELRQKLHRLHRLLHPGVDAASPPEFSSAAPAPLLAGHPMPAELRGMLGVLDRHAAMGIALFDKDMRYLFANRCWLGAYGVENDIMGRSHYEVFPEIGQAWKLIHRRCLAGETLQREVDAFPRGDGSIQYISWKVVPWYEGKVVGGLVMLTQDITEEWRAKTRLLDSERRFEGIFNSVHEFIWLLSPQGDILEANQAALDFVGLEMDSVKGLQFVHAPWWQPDPDESRQLEQALRQAKTGELVRYTTQLRGRDDHYIDIEFSIKPVQDDDGSLIYLIPEAKDITALREVEQSLHEINVKFASFMLNTPVLAWIKDHEFKYHYVNPPFERAFDTSAQAILGMTDFELFRNREEAEALRQNDATTIREGTVVRNIEEVTLPTGGFSYSLVYKFPLKVNGRTGVGGIAIDISPQVRAEQELAAANDQLAQIAEKNLQEAERWKSEMVKFAYIIAHDLRAPTRHIQSYAEIIEEELEGQELTEDVQACLENVKKAARKMGEMVDELLAYAKTDQQEVSLEFMSPREMIEDLKRMIDTEYPGIQWKIGPLPAAMYGDRKMLTTVLQNLLENAAKYSSKEAQPIISLYGKEVDGKTVLVVEDNGVGFDPVYRDKLFLLFRRLHDDEDFPGTGIGLANVKRIVQRHKGEVDAFGEPGKGATFIVGLPLRDEPAP